MTSASNTCQGAAVDVNVTKRRLTCHAGRIEERRGISKHGIEKRRSRPDDHRGDVRCVGGPGTDL